VPIDVTKTRLQLSGELGAKAKYSGAIHAVRTIIAEEGFAALYKGAIVRELRGSLRENHEPQRRGEHALHAQLVVSPPQARAHPTAFEANPPYSRTLRRQAFGPHCCGKLRTAACASACMSP
jgi:hypothetical protein